MAFALLSNPNKNFYPTRKKAVSLIVLHVTAGLQDLDMQGADHSAEGTNRYGATTDRAASWHKCVDSDSIADALPDEYTAFHAVNYNGQSLGLEISNKDARWDNKPQAWIDATLRNSAIVCLAWEKKFGIPRLLLSKAQVDAGQKGYSYHMFLDPSRRRDPGTTFSWDYFVKILESLEGGSTPNQEDDMEFIGPGSNKNSIIKLQKKLQAEALKNGRPNPLPKFGADGDYGNETVNAVNGYQKLRGIQTTKPGMAGGVTLSFLFDA